jgi:tetratricopeptide (TPR) repeat protein
MDRARQSAAAAATAFDEAAVGVAVAAGLLVEWSSASSSVVLAAGAEHSRGLQGTVKLALHFLTSHPLAAESCQLLALLALCPPVRTPWSLFDGGGVAQEALMVLGRRVIVEWQVMGHVSVAGRSCRIPKLKLGAAAVSNDVKEGGKVEVRLSDGKVIKVKGSDLVFEDDAAAVDMEGQWMLPRRLENRAEGRVMLQHDDGSVSVLFQRPHEGCHVRLLGPTLEADLNGCFGYVCGAYDGEAQRWPVRVTLASNEVKDVLLSADNLVCSGKVMTVDGNGGVKAVPAFASGVLTMLRPGAEVMRLRGEDVKAARAEGVLAGVTDALGGVATAVGSSGLVEVEEDRRVFGMHQLLQQAVRAELGDVHDGVMAALLEARCGCMGDEHHIDHRMQVVTREVVAAAGYVLGGKKAAAAHRAEWVCGMRVRVLLMARTVLGYQSLEARSYYDALDADLSALGAKWRRPEYRAMVWSRKCCTGTELSFEELMRDVEDAKSAARDAAAAWDCRAALGIAQHMAGSLMNAEGKYDKAIELYERALRIETATLGEMHAFTAATISSMGVSYTDKGQQDRAIELYERALRIQTATLGDMHHSTAATISSMGVSYGIKGQQDRAIELYERALHIRTATFGEKHVETARTIGSMGASYSNKGQQDRAIELYERALRIQTATLGEMHASTAATISSMGVSYGSKGQQDRAIELYERALRIRTATLGKMHHSTAATISSMGTSYSIKGQLDRAIELYERALRIRTATLGEMHADTAQTISSMGTSYSKKGQQDRAIELFERALRIRTATLGEMHADTARTIGNMGASYSDMGQQDRAIELYERALRIETATLGEMHASTAATISSMGVSYGIKGQQDRAIELYERALRIRTATLGEMHHSTAATISSMGVSYFYKGQLDRAIAETQRALRICLAVLGPRHPQTQETQQNLANMTSATARARAGRGRR